MLASLHTQEAPFLAHAKSPSATVASQQPHERHETVSLLLHLMHALLSHESPRGTTVLHYTSDTKSDDEASLACDLHCLLLLLCRFCAVRAALPECVAEHVAVRWTTQRQHGGGMKCGKGTTPFCGVESTVACLLPLFSTGMPKVEVFGVPQQRGPSSAPPRQTSDAEVQQNLDAVLLRLKVHVLPEIEEEDTNNNDDTRVAPARHTLRRLCKLYHKIREDDAYLCRPTPLSCEDTALLLRVYATSAAETAAASLLRILPPPPSVPLTCAEKLAAAREAFARLLDAQQAARSALSYFADAPCDELLQRHIRPLLAALTSGSEGGASDLAFMHPSVEVTADPVLSVSGRGLVTTAAIQEGELLVRESSLCTTAAINSVEETSAVVERVAAALTTGPGKETSCSGSHTATISASARKGEGLSAAARVVDFFASCSPSSLEHVTWWYRWALALPPQTFTSVSTQGEDMRASILEAACAAFRLHSQGVASAHDCNLENETSPAQELLHLLSIREVDELRLPCPELDTTPTWGQGSSILLPRPVPDASAALFCLLRFVNHACTPNAIVVFDADRGGPSRVTGSLVALRDIEAGEAVTISYVPATTALTVSQSELAKILGFACRCPLCTDKAALLHGAVCGECRQLVHEQPPAALQCATENNGSRFEERRSSAFHHAPQCSHRQREAPFTTVGSVAAQLRSQLDRLAAQTTDTEATDSCCAESHSDEQDCACNGGHHACAESASLRPDPLVGVLRQLLDLDDCVAHTLLPTHHLRLRARLEAFAYASAARGLGSTVSSRLIHLCATTVEELEVLLGVHHPLVTGLRMYLVFSRSRHVRAVEAAAALEHGTRHADCCGAVREQAALMALPFVLDPLVRRCVARCFQEHFVQLVGWKAAMLPADVTEAQVLRSFLCRYPVELEAAGCTTLAHMELLACMEDGEAAV